jgi:signal transduction histidine kinase
MLAETAAPSAEPRRFSPYIAPGLLIASVVAIAVLALIEATPWIQRPFAGFFFYSSGLVSPMQRSEWQGRKAGIRPGDQVVSIDGIPIQESAAIRDRMSHLEAGAQLRVELVRGAERRVLTLRAEEFTQEDVLVTLATPFSIGIFYLLMGSVIFFFKPRAPGARLLLLLLSLISIFYLTTFDANTTWMLERIWICYPLFAAVAVHLFTVFPEEWAVAKRYPWVRAIAYIIAGTLIFMRQVFLDAAEGTTALAYVSTAFVTAVTFANFILLALVWRQTDSQITIRKVKVILVGLLVTSTLGVVWSYAARVDPEAITWDMAMLLSAPFPILMTYAALKHNIFDVDVVLRTTAIYVLSSVLVVALYFAVVASFTLLTQQVLPFYEATPTAIVATLAVAVAFHPLRVRVQRFLNRFFFREKYDLRKAVGELTLELSKVTEVPSLARVLTGRLQRLMRLKAAALFVQDPASQVLTLASAVPQPASEARFAAEGGFAALLRDRPRPQLVQALIETGRVPPEDRARLEAFQARLVVPLLARDALLGILLLGGERFDDIFTQQDQQLLESLQMTLAIALQNALLYMERAEKERLAALGQVASLIIHEVKNPLGIIRVSIGTIKRKLGNDSSRELATFIEEEVDRMNRTIAKILTFARPQEAQPEPCDLNEVVERTLAFVGPDLEGAEIELVAELDRGAPPVRADAEQVQQMLLNLILNAKAALKAGGRIRVRTDGAHGPGFAISVEDNGAGMDADTRAKIFTPFFTTRRGGTGLGLAIVQQIVEAHRGEIRVESEPGKGSRFTVLLPNSPAPGEHTAA